MNHWAIACRSGFANDATTSSGTRLDKRADRTNECTAMTVGANEALSYHVEFLPDTAAKRRSDST